MKKVILGAVALMIGGFAFAQNTSNSTQSGNDQRVYVRQAGTLLNSEIDQSNGGGSGSHRAMVLQRGSGNDSDIWQAGSDNEAYVEQGAQFTPPTNATANITQGGTNAASEDNKARIEQHGGTGSTTTMTQDGDENEAYAHQDHTTSTITIDQDGNENKSAVYQLPYYASANNTATITQNGDENKSWASQDGNGNTLNATQ